MSREYPDYPMVGVGVVVWKDNAVLLIQRGKPPRAGTWSLPGGRQELGETTREAGVREVREETGLEVDIKDLIDVVDTIHRDDEGRVRMQYTLVDYWAEWVSGELVAGTDAADARWVDPADLPAYNLWDETLRVIDLFSESALAPVIHPTSGERPEKPACEKPLDPAHIDRARRPGEHGALGNRVTCNPRRRLLQVRRAGRHIVGPTGKSVHRTPI